MQRVPPNAQPSPTNEPISPPPHQAPAANSTLEDHVARLDQQLVQLRAQVRQAQQLAHMGIAAPMIAHEVNNLLTPILSYAGYARGCDDVELKNKALDVTVKNVKMLVEMSERVLQVSAASSSRAESCRLSSVVQDALDSMCRDLSKDGIKLVLDIDEGSQAWCDPLQLQQVLFNLFLNARKAMAKKHGGRLTVAARQIDRCAVITIKDTGEGIAPEILPYVFDPLQSSKKSREDGRHRCSGLGLALCRDLIQENSGTLEVAGESGDGATFTITLPIDQPPAK